MEIEYSPWASVVARQVIDRLRERVECGDVPFDATQQNAGVLDRLPVRIDDPATDETGVGELRVVGSCDRRCGEAEDQQRAEGERASHASLL